MTIKYKFTLNIGYSGCDQKEEFTIEELGYTNDEWILLSEEAKKDILYDCLTNWSYDHIDKGYELIE